MLEIVYDKDTKEIRAWCGDSKEFGNFKPREGQEVVVWDIPIPRFDSGEYTVDEANQIVIDGNPDYIAPIPFDTKAEIDVLTARLNKAGVA